jgi:predicted RNA-binding Zn-ribbon protein involved in translation (DUF1610 family)
VFHEGKLTEVVLCMEEVMSELSYAARNIADITQAMLPTGSTSLGGPFTVPEYEVWDMNCPQCGKPIITELPLTRPDSGIVSVRCPHCLGIENLPRDQVEKVAVRKLVAHYRLVRVIGGTNLLILYLQIVDGQIKGIEPMKRSAVVAAQAAA